MGVSVGGGPVRKAGGEMNECLTCRGSGAVLILCGATDEPTYSSCPDCNGTSISPLCPECGGHGTPPGEFHGMVCGACLGSGIESTEEID